MSPSLCLARVSGYVWRLQQAGDFSAAEIAVQRANAEASGESVGRSALVIPVVPLQSQALKNL